MERDPNVFFTDAVIFTQVTEPAPPVRIIVSRGPGRMDGLLPIGLGEYYASTSESLKTKPHIHVAPKAGHAWAIEELKGAGVDAPINFATPQAMAMGKLDELVNSGEATFSFDMRGSNLHVAESTFRGGKWHRPKLSKFLQRTMEAAYSAESVVFLTWGHQFDDLAHVLGRAGMSKLSWYQNNPSGFFLDLESVGKYTSVPGARAWKLMGR